MSHTYEETLNQPYSWRETLNTVPTQWRRITDNIKIENNTHFLFIGSGTSYYLAQSAAHAFQELTGHVATAVPASELFLSPQSTLPSGVPVVAFLISRSGTTSEGLIAASYLRDRCPNVYLIGLTCNTGTELSQRAHAIIQLPHASEKSIVMTQSFTNMLLALLLVAAEAASNQQFHDELALLPGLAREVLVSHEALAKAIGSNLEIDRFIYLGLGPYFGLAQEAMLKLKEMTQVPCEAYSPLEFRHGPVSTIIEGTAVVMLEGIRDREYSQDVGRDMKQHGAHVVALSPFGSDFADDVFSLPPGLSDLARCVLYLPALQLIAYYRALAVGLDPDHPRLLNQVVIVERRS